MRPHDRRQHDAARASLAQLLHRHTEIEMLVVAAGDDLACALREQGEAGDLVADGVGRLDLDRRRSRPPSWRAARTAPRSSRAGSGAIGPSADDGRTAPDRARAWRDRRARAAPRRNPSSRSAEGRPGTRCRAACGGGRPSRSGIIRRRACLRRLEVLHLGHHLLRQQLERVPPRLADCRRSRSRTPAAARSRRPRRRSSRSSR